MRIRPRNITNYLTLVTVIVQGWPNKSAAKCAKESITDMVAASNKDISGHKYFSLCTAVSH
jgi:hypothetical protein